MSILPKWHNGRVCIPWWYGLGYPVMWCLLGVGFGMKIGADGMLALTTESSIALVLAAFVGALAYTVLYAVSAYNEQRAQAAEVKAKIVQTGRDPDDPTQLTLAEKWDINKCAKFDKIFLIADFFQVILGTALAVAVVYFYGSRLIPDVWEQYAVLAFIAGIVAAWFLGETIIKMAAAGEWSKKAADAFQVVKTAVEDAVKAIPASRKEELIAKFIADGFSKKEAQELAREAILAELKK